MDIFYALSEPKRRDIIELLASNGELSASDISHKFQISPQAISQHLKVLKESDLVVVQKRAQQRIYQINPNKMQELEIWTKRMLEMWSKRYRALDKLLEIEKAKLNNN